MQQKMIRIGGASGYWGDGAAATGQLLDSGRIDFIVYDYLAEITMSIMARARADNAALGYATDFISVAMAPNLAAIQKQGVKIISNAGGVNPRSCADALRTLIDGAGLDLKVACVTGDDLLDKREQLATMDIADKGKAFPPSDKIASINVYTGAFAIARALEMGADIVVTGRCVDSAVTLGACIHSFGWQSDAYDLLASGSLAGHIIECGAQACGGNFTDWHLCADSMDDVGYPIVEISQSGEFSVCKPMESRGLVSVGTVGEQIVYEIGDPQSYLLPDVSCDFSQVRLRQISADIVGVSGAVGRVPPQTLKTIVTWHDGFRGGHLLTFYGFEAVAKAKQFADGVIKRSRRSLRDNTLPDFRRVSIEVLGADSQYGANGQADDAREVCVKIAAHHDEAAGIHLMLREMTAMALSGPPGLSGFAGTRPRPSPVIALFTCQLAREILQQKIGFGDNEAAFIAPEIEFGNPTPNISPGTPPTPDLNSNTVGVPLIKLALGRSGDKGNHANIGIIAREKKYLPFIWQQLDEKAVARHFAHFLDSDTGSVQRYFMPGMGAINYVLENVLDGGGTSSLRNDPQAKGYGQLLLSHEIQIPVEMAAGLL